MIFTVTFIEKCSLHSASLGTDPSLLANHNPAIFSIPLGTEKLNKSPRLHIFDNTYTDFRTAYKRLNS